MAGTKAGRVLSKTRELIEVARRLGVGEVARDVRRWAWSDESFVRVRRTVAGASDAPPRPELRARPLSAREATELLSRDLDGASPDERRLLLRRLRLTEHGIGAPWLVECDGEPAYLDWFFLPADNPTIASFYGGLFQPLADDEVLGESGYVFPPFRGRAIASAGLSMMLAGVAPPSATWLVAYIPVSNTRNLRNVAKNVFTVDALVRVRWRLARRTITVEPWADDPANGVQRLIAGTDAPTAGVERADRSAAQRQPVSS